MDEAIAALLVCRTQADAARKIGVSRRTLLHWMKHEGFRRRYEAAQRELLESTINGLRSIGGDAVVALRDVVTDAASGAPARVSGSRAILENLLRACELQDVARRISELEKTLGESK
jgi:hypothetical protein